jgi:hypothetical protein
MRRTILTADQRAALQQARHDPSRPSYARDRIELLLSAADRSPPRIAAPLGCHAKTVRHLLDRFPQEGLDCLVRQPPGPPPDAARRCTVSRHWRRCGPRTAPGPRRNAARPCRRSRSRSDRGICAAICAPWARATAARCARSTTSRIRRRSRPHARGSRPSKRGGCGRLDAGVSRCVWLRAQLTGLLLLDSARLSQTRAL